MSAVEERLRKLIKAKTCFYQLQSTSEEEMVDISDENSDDTKINKKRKSKEDTKKSLPKARATRSNVEEEDLIKGLEQLKSEEVTDKW